MGCGGSLQKRSAHEDINIHTYLYIYVIYICICKHIHIDMHICVDEKIKTENTVMYSLLVYVDLF